MSQPHPPIPEPQPHTAGSTAASAGDLPGAPPPAPGPRTQSILVPPGHQQHAAPEPPAEPFRTAQFPAVRDEPAADPAGLHSPPPVPGPLTAPVATSEPHPQTNPVTAPAGNEPAAGPGAAHRAGERLAGVRRAAGGRGRRVLVALGLGALALALLQAGLVLEDGTRSLWAAVPTWSTFATLAVLVTLVPLVVGLLGRGLPARTAWQVGAGGVAALGAFWVLVGLPLVVSDRGFWLTAALAAAACAVWLAPGRTE
ncbi:hypothetical protein GCU67_06620 [Modestobacter muralis]|uniref:Uncharacterized protein n=1 Tax=Modestobacter muralis TaxID=1608614 RepID=A0A6P0EX49_9ACTN|nr:hypothetical protein [Modestobacter muralis]NEK93848.1 hypothetical protein [Modestobacter muralis]NEN50615.1 hypothetical protein [Modestobacter muralis]